MFICTPSEATRDPAHPTHHVPGTTADARSRSHALAPLPPPLACAPAAAPAPASTGVGGMGASSSENDPTLWCSTSSSAATSAADSAVARACGMEMARSCDANVARPLTGLRNFANEENLAAGAPLNHARRRHRHGSDEQHTTHAPIRAGARSRAADLDVEVQMGGGGCVAVRRARGFAVGSLVLCLRQQQADIGESDYRTRNQFDPSVANT